MSQSIYQALLDMVTTRRSDLLAAETALADHANDLVKKISPFQEGDTIADCRVFTKPFAVVERVFCPDPDSEFSLAHPRIMVRKIRADGQASLNIQQLRNPDMYVKFKTATPIEDDEL